MLGNGLPRTDASGPAMTSAEMVTPANGSGCMCGAPGGTCTCGDAGPSHFVYVLGTVDVKFPDQSISAEFQKLFENDLEKKAGRELQQDPNEDLRHWYWRILTAYPKETRYIARQFCWILRVEGEPAYYLTLRDMQDFDGLIDCLGEPNHDDLCLFVGSSSLQLVEMSHGIKAPMLAVDQVHRFKMSDMLEKFKSPTEKETLKSSAKKESSAKKGKPKSSEQKDAPDPDKLYGELYKQLFQSADNFGHTDEWRALNFLAAGGHPPVFQLCSVLAHEEYNLTALPVLTSRLSAWGNKRIVDAIFTFGRAAEMRKFFVRVDVTHLFPILVSRIATYVDRVNL
jgi:hypothetical protein